MAAEDAGDLTLVAELKQAVEDSGLSLSEIARRCGISHSQMSRFMRGERLLALDAASKLFDALGLRVERERLPDDDTPPPKKPAPKKPKR